MKFLLLIPIFLVGCAELGRPIDQNKLALIKRGETTKEQVFQILGPARYVSTTDGPDGKQTVLTYLYYHTSQMGALFMGQVDTRNQTATIVIGADGKVETISATTEGTWDNSTNAPAPAKQMKGATTSR